MKFVLQKQGSKDKKTLREERGNFEADCLPLALCVLNVVMDVVMISTTVGVRLLATEMHRKKLETAREYDIELLSLSRRLLTAYLQIRLTFGI